MPFNNNPNNYLPNNMGVPSSQVTWVRGYEEASKYQVPKNSNAVLFDSEIEGRFYIKVTDNIGMYNMRIFNFQEITPSIQNQQNVQQQQQQQSIQESSYVTYDQMTQMLSQMQNNIVNTIKEEFKHEQSLPATQPGTTGKYTIVSSSK